MSKSTHGQHLTRNTAWSASEQLTITANHHHEGALLTVALMSGKRHFGLAFCACHWHCCQIHRKLLLFWESLDWLTLINYSHLQIFTRVTFTEEINSSYFYYIIIIISFIRNGGLYKHASNNRAFAHPLAFIAGEMLCVKCSVFHYR